jgi:hypothetical protein
MRRTGVDEAAPQGNNGTRRAGLMPSEARPAAELGLNWG